MLSNTNDFVMSEVSCVEVEDVTLQVHVCLAKHLYKRKQGGLEGAGAARRITSKRRHNVGGHVRESTSEKQRGENKEPATQTLMENVHHDDKDEE